MAMNLMEHKGYHARIDFDPAEQVFHGRVIGIRDVLSFHGTSVAELTRAFHETVDDYLAWCAEDGIEPETAWAEDLSYHPSDDLRHRLHLAAAATNQSVGEFMDRVLDRAAREAIGD